MAADSALADIREISSLTPLKKLLCRANEDTLVIFDVDHVLIMPTDEYDINLHPYRKELWQELCGRISTNEIKLLTGITLAQAEWDFVDPDITNIFTDLERRRVPTIALTALYTGKLGNINKAELWRCQHLQDLGFNFAELSPIKKDLLLHELEENGSIPMLKSGVILTSQIDKGKVLEIVLHRSKYYPKTIIFIDDILENLESLAKLCLRLEIEFYGFHYKAALGLISQIIDKQREKLRFQILEKDRKWVNYSKLDKML